MQHVLALFDIILLSVFSPSCRRLQYVQSRTCRLFFSLRPNRYKMPHTNKFQTQQRSYGILYVGSINNISDLMQYRTIISCILHKNIKNSDKRCTIEVQHFCNNCCYLAETRSKLFRCSVYIFHALKGKTCSKAKTLIRRISLSVLPSTITVMQWPSASLQHFPI